MSGAPRGTRVVLVPGVLALLPEHAGLTDPVAELRAACARAVSWLVEDGPGGTGGVVVVADPQGRRIAEQLLENAGRAPGPDPSDRRVRERSNEHGTRPAAAYLVVANGSARRTEKAPGHLDERSPGYDADLDTALRTPDPAALRALDDDLAEELWVGNVAGLRRLGELLDAPTGETGASGAEVDYADDPYGVQYWVMRWTCGS